MATTWTNPAAAVDVNRVRVSQANCTTGTEAPNPRGAYNAATNYVANDMASFGGTWWLAILGSNGKQPDLSPAFWLPATKMGLDLKGLQAVTPHVEVQGAGVVGAAAALQGYLLNPATGQWNRAPAFDLPLTAALVAQGLPAFPVNGGAGRLLLLPNAVGAPCVVYLNGSPMPSLLAR